MKEVFKYSEFLKTSITKEFRGKYKKSFLGILWSFINPLLQVIIYSVVFSFIMKAGIDHFTTFLIIGLIPWNFFNTTVAQGSSTIIANGGILKKIYFPREILPISIVTSNLINFLISCIIIFVAVLISGIGITWHALLIPLVVLIQYILTLGITFMVSSVTVYIRDLEYFINVLMMLWFYLCPIVYSADFIPLHLKPIFELNPMFHIINAYRDLLYYHQIPDLNSFAIISCVSILFLYLGYKIFKKLEKRFVEEL